MPSRFSQDAGPDGFGPIDAVVTWVDGDDPGFRLRRQQAVDRLKREDRELARRSEIAFSPARFVQHDEIRYCVRSILNHAPWMRRIWLVTDDQFPDAFDRAKLDPRIVLVSHRELFREFADALPVFNSGAIEALSWRIEGISDRFVYFNDDFFLTRPSAPRDFFDGPAPVLHGRWAELGQPVPGWLQRRINSATLFGFGSEQFFKEAHVPYSLSRPILAELFARYPGLLEKIARRRFRSADDYNVIALHNHFCLAEGLGLIDEVNRWLVYGSYPEGKSKEAIRDDLRRIGSMKFLSTCINGLGSFVEALPDVYDYLDAGTMPRVAFER